MCLGVPGRIEKLRGREAIVDVGGIKREISVELLPDLKEGDYVIIHAGFAISKIDEEEVEAMLDFWRSLAQDEVR